MDKNLKKSLIIVACILVLILILIVPVKSTCNDGGTVISSALTYKKIKWNVMHGYNNTYRTGEEIHFFPNNFGSYDDYYTPEETVKLDYESKPIWVYVSDGEEAHKITNTELMEAIITPLNSATYTYVGKAAEDEATISISVGDIERQTIYFEVKDAHTVIFDGYIYQSDIETSYDILCEVFENN